MEIIKKMQQKKSKTRQFAKCILPTKCALRIHTPQNEPKWHIAPCYICALSGVTTAKHNPKWYGIRPVYRGDNEN